MKQPQLLQEQRQHLWPARSGSKHLNLRHQKIHHRFSCHVQERHGSISLLSRWAWGQESIF